LIGAALPVTASKAIASATSKGLEAALKVALRTLPASPSSGSSALLHRALATASGAVGGTFGLAALPIELPVSTVIMLRSIADIARSEGEDLQDPATALACVEVFALGGRAGQSRARQLGGGQEIWIDWDYWRLPRERTPARRLSEPSVSVASCRRFQVDRPERERYHHHKCADDGQRPERVDIGEQVDLPLQGLSDPGDRLRRRI
jgi:EcsC protein family